MMSPFSNLLLPVPACRRSARTSRGHRLAHRHAPLIEALESRMLLSATGYATPDFQLLSSGSTLQPATSRSAYGLFPSTIRQAYGINQISFAGTTADGSGQTIAIVDAYNDPTLASDLHAFDQQFSLTDPSLSIMNENGGTSLPANAPGRGDSWALEISLDVEWAHAIAPAANIQLVEANSASEGDLLAAVNTARNLPGVSVISMSWGETEQASDVSDNSDFTTPAGHTPITFIASAGDRGAYSSPASKAINFPASSPNVLAIGGTELTTSSNGNYASETGWGTASSSFFNGGSGGGISLFQQQPSYQAGIVTQSSNFRTTPDVAFDADPDSGVAVYDSYDSANAPWIEVGGTSLGAPAWAGIIAIADQGRSLAGQSTLNGPSQTLPSLYALPAADFHDITTGNNGYAAGPGYDLVTGRGSPIANKLVAGLVAVASPNNSGPSQNPAEPTIGKFAISTSTVASGANITLTANNVSETGGSIASVTFYEETNDIAGLQTLTDTLLGKAIRSGNNWSLTTSTQGLAPGTYTLYALATDTNGAAASEMITVDVTAASGRANDNFANAAKLSGTTLTATGSNVGATKQTGEPNHTGNTGGKSVWWSWTAPTSGLVSLNTAGSNFDTLLAVYTGTAVNSLTHIAANDDAVPGHTLTSNLTFNAIAGVTYYFAVDGYNGASGKIVLNLSEMVPPANRVIAATDSSSVTSPVPSISSPSNFHLAGILASGAPVPVGRPASSPTISLNLPGTRPAHGKNNPANNWTTFLEDPLSPLA